MVHQKADSKLGLELQEIYQQREQKWAVTPGCNADLTLTERDWRDRIK